MWLVTLKVLAAFVSCFLGSPRVALRSHERDNVESSAPCRAVEARIPAFNFWSRVAGNLVWRGTDTKAPCRLDGGGGNALGNSWPFSSTHVTWQNKRGKRDSHLYILVFHCTHHAFHPYLHHHHCYPPFSPSFLLPFLLSLLPLSPSQWRDVYCWRRNGVALRRGSKSSQAQEDKFTAVAGVSSEPFHVEPDWTVPSGEHNHSQHNPFHNP